MFSKLLVLLSIVAFVATTHAADLVDFYKRCYAGDSCAGNFQCVYVNPYYSQCKCQTGSHSEWVSTHVWECVSDDYVPPSAAGDEDMSIPFFGACKSMIGQNSVLGTNCRAPFECVYSGDYYSQCKCQNGYRSKWISGPPDVFTCVPVNTGRK